MRSLGTLLIFLLLLAGGGWWAYKNVPQVHHHPLVRKLLGNGVPVHTVRPPVAPPRYITDPYYDYKSLPAFVVDNVDVLKAWGKNAGTPAARRKAIDAIAKSLAIPAGLKKWGLYVESHSGNAILAGGVMVGAVVGKEPVPIMLVVEGGQGQPLAQLESSGRVTPDKWKIQRTWLWHKPKGQAIVSLVSDARPHAAEPQRNGPPVVTWQVLVNGVLRPSQLAYSDVEIGDGGQFFERALITGTVAGKEFGKGKALFFLTPAASSSIGDFALAPVAFRPN
jgi:hypothetical protein